MNKAVIASLCLISSGLLAFFSPQVMRAASDGILLWADKVLPALFPFFIFSSMLCKCGMFDRPLTFGKSRRFSTNAIALALVSFISGAPAGARLCGELSRRGVLCKSHAQRYCAVFNAASPMFICGTLCAGMLGMPWLAVPIMLSQLLSSISVLKLLDLLFPISCDHCKRSAMPVEKGFASVLTSLPDSILDGVTSMLRIGGTIVFFSVLIELLKILGLFDAVSSIVDALPFAGKNTAAVALAAFIGSVEMVNGCLAISSLSISAQECAALCAGTISAGGICILMQSMSFIELNPIKYLGIKQAQGILAGLIAYFLTPLFGGATAVFNASTLDIFGSNLGAGALAMLCSAFALAIICLMSLFIRSLSKRQQKNNVFSKSKTL